MKLDLVLAGVGGQGVVSLGVVVAAAARREGLNVLLSEVHGMAQRGGSVQANLRLADGPIHGALIARGTADAIVATEPLEGLRQLPLMKPDGLLLSGSEPLENISDYPDVEDLRARIDALPHSLLVDADRIAREAGNAKAANLALIGALSPLLPVPPETIETEVRERFGRLGEAVVDANLRAFRAGREIACPAPA